MTKINIDHIKLTQYEKKKLLQNINKDNYHDDYNTNTEIINFLIDMNNIKDIKKYCDNLEYKYDVVSTLAFAAGNGNLEIVKYLINLPGRDCEHHAFYEACDKEHLEIVEYLINHESFNIYNIIDILYTKNSEIRKLCLNKLKSLNSSDKLKVLKYFKKNINSKYLNEIEDCLKSILNKEEILKLNNPDITELFLKI